jgi:glutathione S-transferase
MPFQKGIFFSHFHTVKLPSAISRYRKEVYRVLRVLEAALEGKRYIVGDKVTIADLGFVPWHSLIPVCTISQKMAEICR